MKKTSKFLTKRLPRAFYDRKAEAVAKALLGKYLVHIHNGIEQVGRIVETEAYVGQHDLAAHSCRGVTPRNRVMFGPPGHVYVYLIYGIYHCMNIVTEEEGKASAVLLRALEPVQNVESRTQGPGLLTKAMGIDKRLHESDILSDHLFIADAPAVPPRQIIKKPRIGVDYAGEWAQKLLRFYIKDNPFISKK